MNKLFAVFVVLLPLLTGCDTINEAFGAPDEENIPLQVVNGATDSFEVSILDNILDPSVLAPGENETYHPRLLVNSGRGKKKCARVTVVATNLRNKQVATKKITTCQHRPETVTFRDRNF